MSENTDFPFFNHNDPDPAMRSRQFKNLVNNIVTTHDQLKNDHPEVLKTGTQWYDRAQETADRIGRGDMHKGAGILAALSPRKLWGENVRLAQEMVKSGTTKGHTAVQIRKARRIFEGEAPTDVLGGPKETSFYHNISDPNNPHHVTIDRHAHDVAIGKKYGSAERGLGAKGRYETFHNAYNLAARHLGFEVPSRLQAGVWTGQEQGLTRFS
jgi:hypothetical protein